ncbi:FecR family protein [Providencia rettgeri]|uniref:FecR family protein n=1 Tax=Providencia sp. TaxID=589 RepID=UPI0024ABE88E|nr:FecR domain-containing protein [Providencia rettgeri]
MKSTSPSEIENTAAMWVVKTTQRELNAQENSEFQHWVNASTEHANAYYRARQIWALTSCNQLPKKIIKPIKAANSYLKTTIAASVLVCGLAMLLWWNENQESIDYQAKIGEVQHITLPDGSQVDLDSGAQLQLAFDGQYRQVNLLQGRAYFSVAPITGSELRPFQVKAKNGVTQALGTEFVIDTEGDHVDVSVYQHSVKISLLSGQEQVVKAGQFTQYQRQISPTMPIAKQNSEGWREGQITFQQQTLSEIAAKISRYHKKKIIILASDSEEKLSGVLQINTLESGLKHLTSSKGLTIYEVPYFTLIY